MKTNNFSNGRLRFRESQMSHQLLIGTRDNHCYVGSDACEGVIEWGRNAIQKKNAVPGLEGRMAD